MRYTRFYIFSVVLVALLFGGVRSNALAQDVSAANELYKEGVSPSGELRARFYNSLELLFQKQFAAAADEFRALTSKGRDYGFRNFPDFSLLLLKEAQQRRKSNPDEAAFLVRHSLQLSPTDLSIALSALAFDDLVERQSLVGHIRSVFWANLYRPGMLIPLLSNMTLLLLGALTVAVLVAVIVQLLRNGEAVFRYITRFVPKNYRGIFGPLAVLGCLILPLFGGLAISVTCWVAILGRSVLHCRWLAVAAGVVFLSWMGVLQVALPVKNLVLSETAQVVDQVNANSLVLNSEEVLRRAIEKEPQNSLLVFSLARVFLFENRFLEAEKLFRTAGSLTSPEQEIYRVAQLNVAVIAMRQHRYEEARRILEEEEAVGGGRFEVLYNLALVHLAQLDLEKYRSYYSRAQKMDPKEWGRLDAEQGEKHLPALSNLRFSGLMKGFAGLQLSVGVAEQFSLAQGTDRLLSSLFYRPNLPFLSVHPKLLGAFGIFLILVAVLRRSASGRRWIEQYGMLAPWEVVPTDSSLLWSLLPGGAFLAGKKPVLGVVVATLCLAAAFVTTGWPMHFFSLSKYPFSFRSNAILAFSVIYMLGIIVPFAVMMLQRAQSSSGVYNR